ncbi:hypothetical protein OG453_03770 [Streptomyces sp. NBC_01381]|uniref:hypothetical protein n=1 Tax=Streptomyces sp. NBC_01381 TaxID=2903845 RepID=UPI002257881B|nr:hypothetical protein [Streptomyces sp. NBC_01381]MCX4665799.1 hypothetical protein [Streptomyces sp. NBC_01381]
MTTTTDSAGHPEVAEISDLTEGLLAPARTLDVRRHLDDCELCADVYASLEEIRGMLGTLPGPPRMPADVAGRIDAALAAEALLDSIMPESLPSESFTSDSLETETDAPDTASTGARVSRETSPGSAEPAVTPTPGPSADRPAGHPRAATGPGRRSRFRGGRRRTAVLGAVVTAAAIGLGTLLMQNLGGGSGGTAGTSSDHTASAHAFSEERLKGQVTDLLAKNPAAEPEAGKPSFDVRSSPESPKENSPMREAAVSVPECVQRGLGARTPIAAEEGTYKGKDAYLVVASHDSDSTKVSAYVVDATCTDKPSSSTAAGKILLTNSYARP